MTLLKLVYKLGCHAFAAKQQHILNYVYKAFVQCAIILRVRRALHASCNRSRCTCNFLKKTITCLENVTRAADIRPFLSIEQAFATAVSYILILNKTALM